MNHIYKLTARTKSFLHLLLFLVLCNTAAYAQTPVSNLTCGYTYGNTPAPNWTSILNGSGTTVVDSGLAIDDQNYMNNAFPAGFTLDFNGTLYTSFNISANGFIFFGNTDPGVITNPISNATVAYTGAISALGANIQAHEDATNTPQIMVQTSGTAPDRIVTIEWSAFKPQGNDGGFCTFVGFSDWNRYDFQIKLYENGGANSNTIDIIHKNQGPICIDSNGLSAQVGLRGASNADFRNRSRNGSTSNTNTNEGTSNTDAITHGAGQYFNANTRMRYTPGIQPAAIEGEIEVCVEDGISLTEGNNLPGATYQWYASPANTPIGSATSQTYSVSPGVGSFSYYVTVSNAGGCLRVSPVYTVNVIACGGGITVTSSTGTGGTISPSGVISYNAGDTPTYTFAPSCGYEISSITVNGSPVAIASSYTFSPLASSGSISVTYTLKTEICNGIDDDCDGSIDEGLLTTYYLDADGDGYGSSTSTQACSAPVGYVSITGDCNDSNNAVHPGATETCNSIDDDCDGSIDEGLLTTYYLDADGDGFGGSTSIQACFPTAGYVLISGDCNDNNNAVNPDAIEICNGIDDDCDGGIDNGLVLTECQVCNEGSLIDLPFSDWYQDADGDGFGNAEVSITDCNQPLGYVSNSTDCDDTDETITNVCFNTIVSTANAGGSIAPLGQTNVNQGSSQLYTITVDCGYEIVDVLVNGISVGAVNSYTFENVQSDQTISVTFSLRAEVCNGLDDDCDGTTDNVPNLSECQICLEGELLNLPTSTWYADLDGDNHGDADTAVEDCVQLDGYVSSNDDCNDADALIWLAKPAEIVLALSPNETCTVDAPFALGTVSPDGGVWSGNGVSNGNFNPSVAGVGVHTLTYFVPGDGACVLAASASATMTVEICPGIGEESLSEITIYPTQTLGLMTINGNGLMSATMMDLNGKIIESISLIGNRVIDISTYSSGMYLVKVDGQNVSEILKVIKVD